MESLRVYFVVRSSYTVVLPPLTPW